MERELRKQDFLSKLFGKRFLLQLENILAKRYNKCIDILGESDRIWKGNFSLTERKELVC